MSDSPSSIIDMNASTDKIFNDSIQENLGVSRVDFNALKEEPDFLRFQRIYSLIETSLAVLPFFLFIALVPLYLIDSDILPLDIVLAGTLAFIFILRLLSWLYHDRRIPSFFPLTSRERSIVRGNGQFLRMELLMQYVLFFLIFVGRSTWAAGITLLLLFVHFSIITILRLNQSIDNQEELVKIHNFDGLADAPLAAPYSLPFLYLSRNPDDLTKSDIVIAGGALFLFRNIGQLIPYGYYAKMSLLLQWTSRTGFFLSLMRSLPLSITLGLLSFVFLSSDSQIAESPINTLLFLTIAYSLWVVGLILFSFPLKTMRKQSILDELRRFVLSSELVPDNVIELYRSGQRPRSASIGSQSIESLQEFFNKLHQLSLGLQSIYLLKNNFFLASFFNSTSVDEISKAVLSVAFEFGITVSMPDEVSQSNIGNIVIP